MNKKNIYTILLIIGLLFFFFVKNKSSSRSEYVSNYSQYSDQTKCSKSPLLYSYFSIINNEEEDELSHISKFKLLSFYQILFFLKPNINKIKFKTFTTHLFFGTPTYLALKNFRI